MTKFTDLGLSKPLLDALAAKNYTVPTPIQAQAIPTVLTGRDLLGIAQTGTGKTAAFMLPSLDRLANPRVHPIAKRVRMLVLAPTRELASQIADNARNYARNINLTTGVIFGGTAPMKSVREVARGLDVRPPGDVGRAACRGRTASGHGERRERRERDASSSSASPANARPRS